VDGAIDIDGAGEAPDGSGMEHLSPKLRKSPKLRRVAVAVRALWPDGRVPAILGEMERDHEIRKWLLEPFAK
jgi:hypothetical protein